MPRRATIQLPDGRRATVELPDVPQAQGPTGEPAALTPPLPTQQSQSPRSLLPLPPEPQEPSTPGVRPSLPSRRTAEGLGTFVGGMVPGPLGIPAAGLTTMGARGLRDLVAGEPLDMRSIAAAGGRGMIEEATGRTLIGAGAKVARATGLSRVLSAQQQHLRQLFRSRGVQFTAGDITMSPTIQTIEKVPQFFAVGGGRLRKFRRAQLEGFSDAVRGEFATDLDNGARWWGRIIGGRGAKAAKQALDKEQRRLQAQLTTLAGDSPVNIGSTKALARELVEFRGGTPIGPSRAARRLAREGGVVDLVDDITDELIAVDEIPLSRALELQSQLGELGFGSGKLVRTRREGEAARLWMALKDEIRAMTDGLATSDVSDAIKAAAQNWSGGMTLMEDSLIEALAGRSISDAEDVFRRIFQPGDLAPTALVYQVVDAPTGQALSNAWIKDMLEEITVRPAQQPAFVSPGMFVDRLEPFIRSGQLDLMFPGPEGAVLRELVEIGKALETAEGVAGRITPTSPNVLAASQMMNLWRTGIGELTATLAAAGAGAAAAHREGAPVLPSAAAAALAVPFGTSQLVTRGPGIRMLTEGMSGRIARPLTRAATIGAGQVMAGGER